MKLKKTAWKLHKYLSYFVFAQIFLWVLGGIVFATVPFKSLVKGGDFLTPPASPSLPAQWFEAVANFSPRNEQPLTIRAVDSAQGLLIRLTYRDGEYWLAADGREAGKVDALHIARYAESLYHSTGQLQEVRWVSEREPQLLGLVDELSGQTGVWQAVFDDARVYFNGSGEYLKVRTNYWVWYDALWRLHIMDYGDGENFNNNLLRFFSWLAFSFVLTGLVLSFYAFRRTVGWKG